ncbi:hypothetical protein ABEG18_12465 [Alsobacter sp. KACC 23698]|uniref:Uncharacterized protein n=1 Tax=Alsobacter sp. KACC 23698 TaxID=3149229 RepID=A0AAU7JMB9_9HYPH
MPPALDFTKQELTRLDVARADGASLDWASMARDMLLRAAQRLRGAEQAEEIATDSFVEKLVNDLRFLACEMAWSTIPSLVVLDHITGEAVQRIDGALPHLGDGERRTALIDLCRQDAWRIIMDIRRAA